MTVAIELLDTAMKALPRELNDCPPLPEGVVVGRGTPTCRKAHTKFYPESVLAWDSFNNLLDRAERQPYVLHREVFFGTGAGPYGDSMKTQAMNGIRAAIESYAMNAFGFEIMDRDGFKRRLNEAMVKQAYEYAYRVDPPPLPERLLPEWGADYLSWALSHFYTDPSKEVVTGGSAASVTPFKRTIPRELPARVSLLASFIYGAAVEMHQAHRANASAVP